jgi:hypothetical protein
MKRTGNANAFVSTPSESTNLLNFESSNADDMALLLEQFATELLKRCDRLRETADQLERGSDEDNGGIRPYHAAARIRRIANEICRGKE